MAHKQARVAGRIRKILSSLLVREIADPRLQGVTITNVEIDAELMYAKVFVNALSEEEREAEVLTALEHAKGFLRREVAQRVGLRRAPTLTFRWDATLERSERILTLLSTLDIPADGEAPKEPSLAEMALDTLDDDEPYTANDEDAQEETLDDTPPRR